MDRKSRLCVCESSSCLALGSSVCVAMTTAIRMHLGGQRSAEAWFSSNVVHLSTRAPPLLLSSLALDVDNGAFMRRLALFSLQETREKKKHINVMSIETEKESNTNQ